MKFKFVIPIVLCAMVLSACSKDSRDNVYEETSSSAENSANEEIALEWYMDSETLKRAINTSAELNRSSTYAWLETTNQEVYGKECDISFDFSNDKLDHISCFFKTATDKDGQAGTFNALKAGFISDYGEPNKEETRINGTGLPCTYVEWLTEHTHIMMSAYLEEADDFEVTVYFSPSEYKDTDNGLSPEKNDSDISASPNLTVPYGEVLDIKITGETLIIKTKITPSFNNHSTISQNFFNLEDLIKNQDCSKYSEIQYWAVADMTDGSESKVISFTAPKSTIDGINDGSIDAIAYLDDYGYLEDVYILSSLKD